MTISNIKASTRDVGVLGVSVPISTTAIAAPYSAAGPLIAGTSQTPNLLEAFGNKTFKINEFNRSFFPGTRIRASATGFTDAWMEGIVSAWDGEHVSFDVDLNMGAGDYSDWLINVAGEPGQTGSIGPVGPMGPSGGPAGPTGPTGPPGSIWRNGSGAPANTLGVNGDYYLDDVTNNFWLKTGGTYSVAGNLGGATGPTGPTGPQGPQGIIADAPSDGTYYSRRNAAWAPPPGGGDVQHTLTLTAGAGLTGGGDLSANRTFDVGAGAGITVAADTVGLTVPVAVVNGGTGATAAGTALTNLGAAPTASPTFTGTPQAPTPASTDNGTTLATTAFVKNVALGRTGATWTMPGGRLTLSSGNPVMAASVTAATTVYWSPYVNNVTPIYNGTDYVLQQHAELSQATTDTTKSPAAVIANSNYDVFVWNDSGVIRATRGPPWTGTGVRGAGAGTSELARVGGLLVNAQNITNGPAAQRGTYVGTIRSNASSQIDFGLGGAAAGGVAANIMVWNMYNRMNCNPVVTDNGSNYTGSGGAWRQARASTAMQVNFVTGLAENSITASGFQGFTTASNGGGGCGVNLDGVSPTTPDWYQDFFPAVITSGAPSIAMSIAASWGPQFGYHFIAAIENGMGANPTFGGAKLAVSLWC